MFNPHAGGGPGGRHVGGARVLYERANHVPIEPNRPSPPLADGEIIGSTPFEFEIEPGAVDVLLRGGRVSIA